MWFVILVLFFKQKTAYEMRISDWSSDVCSSALVDFGRFGKTQIQLGRGQPQHLDQQAQDFMLLVGIAFARRQAYACQHSHPVQIGRASCRESVCQYV